MIRKLDTWVFPQIDATGAFLLSALLDYMYSVAM